MRASADRPGEEMPVKDLFGKFSGAADTVGIDIGSHFIKVVQLTTTRNGLELARAGSTRTPPDAIKQGVVEDKLAVAQSLNALLRTLGITTPLAVAGVAGPAVVVRQVQLPSMPEQKLRQSIYWEARNYISFPVEDSMVEFQILGTRIVDGAPQMDVMLVATPRDLVDSRVETLDQAGLDPIAIELEHFALMRAALTLAQQSEQGNGTMALVEIGATYTHITLISKGEFILSRSVTIAGKSVTDAIAGALSIDEAHAETVKETELMLVTDEARRAQLSPEGQEASRAVEPLMEELVREIRRSFAFYDYQQAPSGAARGAEGITRIILSGGSANIRGLKEFLYEQLTVPVDTLDLFGAGAIHFPEHAREVPTQAPLLATALGLGLREPLLAHDKGGLR